MAGADQIKSLIKSYAEDDEHRFFTTAMQIAASEARQGHSNVAHELKELIEKARKEKANTSFFQHTKTIPISVPKRELRELIEVFNPRITLNDMVLEPNVEAALESLVKEQRNWEILRKHNLSPKRKLLLTGPPGTGKTMTAQAIAGELGLMVYIVRLDGLISKYMGESIAKLRMIFDAMEEHRAVYLFDEFDSIGSHRDAMNEVGEMKRVLNSFLINIEKDQSNSIIISATNLPDRIDKALFRRFDEIITYPIPGKDQVLQALKMATRGYKLSDEVSIKMLAEIAHGMNFSDIIKSCQSAIKEMILNQRKQIDSKQLELLLTKKKLHQ